MVRLAVLGRHLTRFRTAALAAGDLTHGQFKVLLTLRRGGAPYQAGSSELADLLGLTRGALSARLRPLEEAGLITRCSASPADRRRVRVRLTAAGHAALEGQAGFENRAEAELITVLTPAERQVLADLLRTLVHATEQRRTPPADVAVGDDDRGRAVSSGGTVEPAVE